MERNVKTVFLAKLALFTVAVIWGSSLVVVKGTVDSLAPCPLLAARFTIACVTLCTVFYKHLKIINMEYLKCGAIIGFCLFLAYFSQTIGVMFAMPGKSAFLSSVYCVIVPFLFWSVDKKKPDSYNVASAVICVAGIGLSSMTHGFSICKGDLLALISGFFFASHIVSVGKFGREKDPILITILQFGFCAVFSWIASFAFGQRFGIMSSRTISGVLYLSLICTGVALLLQNIGQKYTEPASASILLSLESVFGVLFSVIFDHEALNLRLIMGFALIFIAVIISETKLSFLQRSSNQRDINSKKSEN